MTDDELRWAEALTIYRQHGDRAALWIAERMLTSAVTGDADGAIRFRQIAAKLEQLLAAERGGLQ